MDYKITCKNCGHTYRLTAEGGQTVIATCPNCGQKMRVNLPIVHSDSQTTANQNGYSAGTQNGYSAETQQNDNAVADDQKKKSGRNHTTNILLALILGILVGGIGWFVWQQKEKNDVQERLELKEARKAHMDSLMALRNQQNAEEEQAQKAEQDQQEVKSFLNNFYDVWFQDGDMSGFANNLSQQCYERLTASSDFDELEESSDSTKSDASSEIDWGTLCPTLGGQKGRHAASPVSLSIDHNDGNWYRIRFTSGGRSAYRQIEAFPQNGKVIINDYR